MACTGTYIGECCTPPVCQGQIVEMQARNNFYPPFDYDPNNNCVLPASGYRRLKITTTWRAVWTNAGPCGAGTFSTVRVEESTITACGAVTTETPVFTGETRTECTSGAPAGPDSQQISQVTTQTSVTTVTRTYNAADPNAVQLYTTRKVEVLDPFPMSDWISELDTAFAYWIENGKGKRTILDWNCNGTGFSVTQSNLTFTPGAGNNSHFFLDLTSQESIRMTITRNYRVYRAVRPYRITTSPAVGASPPCFATSIEDFPKLLGPGIEEVDCIGLNPDMNQTLTLTAL